MKNNCIMKIIIEILKSFAKEKKIISYCDLRQEYNRQSSQPISYQGWNDMLRTVGDYCIENKIPPLNCLVVSRFNLPGSGFFVWYGRLTGTFIDINDLSMMNTIFNICKSECFRVFNEYKNEKE
jgi:hypothetical protein